MTFVSVLLVCIGGIAACAALVFAVETLVAFCLHEREPVTRRMAEPITIDGASRERRVDKAA